MKTTTPTLRLLALACLASLTALPAAAQQEGGYFYGGVGAGQGRAKIDQERISSTLLGAGLTTSGFAADNKSNTYRIFGGYQMNRYFGLEASFFNLGKFGFHTDTTPTGTLDGQVRIQGGGLDLVGRMPITERFSLLGRAGVQQARTRDHFVGSGAVNVLNPTPSKRDTGYKFGVGMQYDVTPNFLVRGEVDRYRVNDAVGNRGTVNVASVSLVFPFGRAPAAAPRMAAAPAYVAPAPTPAYVAPAPVYVPPVVVQAPVVVPPPPIERRRVSFSAESLFGFDKSTLRPEGQAALDTFAREVKGTRFDEITVEGHTDRLGTTSYNQALSLQRAEAVKAYLVSSGAIDASRVKAVGMGEGQPTSGTADCKGSRATPALIACLQADRRVDVEVTGTK
ncbi:MAG: OmpA family protein [Rubrivivax sp.]|nr:OmpA family protein [Rubrivivax sp.]